MKLKPYPKYKLSGVEWLSSIPEGWAVARLGTLSLIETGPFGSQLHSEDYIENGWPVINPAHIQDGKLSPDSNVSVSAETAIRLARHALQAGDIVFGRRGEMGRCALVNEDQAGWLCGTGSLRVALDQTKTAPNFVAVALRTPGVRDWLRLESVGSTMDNLNAAILSRVQLALPSPQEQSEIAAFLDRETAKIDTLIAKQEKLIELLQEKRQTVISHAVTKGLDPTVPMKPTGVEWLGDVPEHWHIAAVGYRYEVALGKMLDEKRITGDHLAPYLRNADVQWDRINTEDLPSMDFDPADRIRYGLRHGDLLVCEGGDVGRAAIWEGKLSECYYQKALHRLRPRNVSQDSPRYMFYLLACASAQGRFTGSEGRSTIAHLTADALRSYRFGFPSISEQDAVVKYLDAETTKIDTLIAKAQQAIELQKEHRTALISAAVTGKIDVRGMIEQEAYEEKAA